MQDGSWVLDAAGKQVPTYDNDDARLDLLYLEVRVRVWRFGLQYNPVAQI